MPEPESYIFKNKNSGDLIPANSQLFVLERNLSSLGFCENKLSEYVNTIKNRYEYIIINCMPQIGTPMIHVMMCADSIVIPTQAELHSTQGLAELLNHYYAIRKNSNRTLRIEGILITMDMERTILSRQVHSITESTFAEKSLCFKPISPFNQRLAFTSRRYASTCRTTPLPLPMKIL